MESEWYYTAGGAQQGPVSQEALQELIASGQLESGAMVWRKGMADWQLPSQVAELSPANNAPAETMAAPPQAQGGLPVQPQSVSAVPHPSQARKQGLAIASLICSLLGLLSFCLWCVSIPLGIAGVVMGHIALSKAKKLPHEFGGEGIGKAGLIIGYIVVVVSIGYTVFVLFFSSFSGDFLQEAIDEAQRQAIEDARESGN